MRTLLFLLSALSATLFSCRNNGSDAVYRVENIDFIIENTKGQNLLSPQTENHLKTDLFQLFYINEKQQKVLMRNADLVASKGYIFILNGDRVAPDEIMSNDKTVVRFFMEGLRVIAGNESELACENYIHWSDTDIDKIECKFVKFKTTSVIITEVVINGQLIWSKDSDPSNTFTLKKVVDGANASISLVKKVNTP